MRQFSGKEPDWFIVPMWLFKHSWPVICNLNYTLKFVSQWTFFHYTLRPLHRCSFPFTLHTKVPFQWSFFHFTFHTKVSFQWPFFHFTLHTTTFLPSTFFSMHSRGPTHIVQNTNYKCTSPMENKKAQVSNCFMCIRVN